jgi:hypothetical protein
VQSTYPIVFYAKVYYKILKEKQYLCTPTQQWHTENKLAKKNVKMRRTKISNPHCFSAAVGNVRSSILIEREPDDKSRTVVEH